MIMPVSQIVLVVSCLTGSTAFSEEQKPELAKQKWSAEEWRLFHDHMKNYDIARYGDPKKFAAVEKWKLDSKKWESCEKQGETCTKSRTGKKLKYAADEAYHFLKIVENPFEDVDPYD